jgi:hypothetical protein
MRGVLSVVVVNGMDRSIGGVHLMRHGVPWRWNERARSIVSWRNMARGHAVRTARDDNPKGRLRDDT